MAKSTVPKHLSASSKRVWRSTVADFGLDGESAALEVLRLALEAVDQADRARLTLVREGECIENRFGQPVAHPAVKIQKDARLDAARLLRELALDVDSAGASSGYEGVRPPRIRSGALS